MRYGLVCVRLQPTCCGFSNLTHITRCPPPTFGDGGIRSCMKKTINLSALHIMAEDKRKGIEAEARPFFNTASYLQRSLGRWFKSSW